MTFPMQAYGGPDLVILNDHRLRDAILHVISMPFPAPADGRQPLAAFAAAMAARFPPRGPRREDDPARAFLASLNNGERLGLLAVLGQAVLATERAKAAITALDIVRSSCGASMVRTGPAAAIHCHYCGGLM